MPGRRQLSDQLVRLGADDPAGCPVASSNRQEREIDDLGPSRPSASIASS